jgi:hypothetical protein
LPPLNDLPLFQTEITHRPLLPRGYGSSSSSIAVSSAISAAAPSGP